MMNGSFSSSGDFTGVAQQYAIRPHGYDGEVALDGALRGRLREMALAGTSGADIGGGSAWLSRYAASLAGAQVLYSDPNAEFLALADAAVKNDHLEHLISLQLAHGENLDYIPTASLDWSFLSNVGCAVQKLRPLFAEAARIVRPGGRVLITAPASLEEIFTVDFDEDAVAQDFQGLIAMAADHNALRPLVRTALRIHRATIAWDSGRPELIRGRTLADGTKISRLISGGTLVPNFAHGHQDYLDAIRAAGLECLDGDITARIFSAEELTEINRDRPLEQTLGARYKTHPAFRLYFCTRLAA